MLNNPNNPLNISCFRRNGSGMPVMGFGTFELQGDVCRHAVGWALAVGYRHLDTARMYENEEQVARGMADSGVPREDIFLTTKLQMGQLHADGVRTSLENSRQALNTDYVDLLLIHWPEEATSLEETLNAMAELQQSGKVRQIGVSNFPVKWLERAIEVSPVPIFCNQVEYHPYLDQTPVLEACRNHHMALVAYSPLARGHVSSDERLIEIGAKHNKTPAQIALRWLIGQSDVIAIPKSSSEQHIRQNIDVFDFELDRDDLAALELLQGDQRLIDPSFAPQWDE